MRVKIAVIGSEVVIDEGLAGVDECWESDVVVIHMRILYHESNRSQGILFKDLAFEDCGIGIGLFIFNDGMKFPRLFIGEGIDIFDEFIE